MADLTTSDIESLLDAPAGTETKVNVDGSVTPTASKGKITTFLPLVGVGAVTYAATESVGWSIGIGLLAQFLAAQSRR